MEDHHSSFDKFEIQSTAKHKSLPFATNSIMQATLSFIQSLKTIIDHSNLVGLDCSQAKECLRQIHEATRSSVPEPSLPREAVGIVPSVLPIQNPIPTVTSTTVYKKRGVIKGARHKPTFISIERLRGIMVHLSEYTDDPWGNLHPTVHARHENQKIGYQAYMEQIDYFLTGNLDLEKGLLQYLRTPEISICEESIRAYAAQNGWPMERQWATTSLDGENRYSRKAYRSLVRPKRVKDW